MSEIGIHAKEGNSYRDDQGQLHYSIGLEVVGYYEHVTWPAPIEQLVGQSESASGEPQEESQHSPTTHEPVAAVGQMVR